VMKYVIDPYPANGLARLFLTSSPETGGVRTREVWVIRKGIGVPEKPKWTKEYVIWLQGHAEPALEKEITPGLKTRGGRAVVPEEERVRLEKWRLKPGLIFVPN